MDLPCSKCKTECLSELLGTYLLVLLGPASIIIVALSRIQPVPAALFVAFSFGATVGLVILVGGKYSGAYVNRAVTVAAAVARELRSNLFLRYVCFQLTGGVLAGLTLRVFFAQGDSTSLGSTKLAQGSSPLLGIVLEAAGTLLLALSALIASSQVKGPWKQESLGRNNSVHSHTPSRTIHGGRVQPSPKLGTLAGLRLPCQPVRVLGGTIERSRYCRPNLQYVWKKAP